MPHFCLPTYPKSGRAVLKIEQNPEKSEKYSTADSKFGPRCPESRTKSSKILKNVLLSYLCQSSVASDYEQISEINVLPVAEVRCSN